MIYQLFLTLLIHSFICYTQHRCENLSPHVVVREFSANQTTKFNNLVVDNDGKRIYIGGVNYLFQLSLDLELEVTFDTRTLSIATNGASEDAESKLDNYNKVLVMDYGNKQLISCGSSFQGTCFAHDITNISRIIATGIEGVIPSDANVSTIASVAVSQMGNSSSALFIGITHTSYSKNDSHKSAHLSIRNLDRSKFLSILGQSGNHSAESFVYAFSYGNFAYFVTNEINSSPYPASKSKLIGIHHNGVDYKYNEISLHCIHHNKEYSSEIISKNYFQVKAASVHNDSLYVISCFSRNRSSIETDAQNCASTQTNIKRAYAICAYPLELVNKTFTNIESALFNKPGMIYGMCWDAYYTNIIPTAITIPSSLNENNTNMFAIIGTSSGHVEKFFLSTYKLGIEVFDITIEESDSIIPRLVPDSAASLFYTLTKNKLMKIRIEDCNAYKVFHDCVREYGKLGCEWCDEECRFWKECEDRSTDLILDASYYPVYTIGTTKKTNIRVLSNISWPFINDTVTCYFDYLNVSLKTSTYHGKIEDIYCQTPDPSLLPALRYDGIIRYAKLSFSTNYIPKQQFGTINFVNCSKIPECNYCLRKFSFCTWIFNKELCVDDTNSSEINDTTNDLKITDHNTCPKIFTRSAMDIWIPSNGEKIKLKAQITLPDTFLEKGVLSCKFKVDEETKMIPANKENEQLICKEMNFTYSSPTSIRIIEWSVLYNNSISIPNYIKLIAYKCEYMNDECDTCLNDCYKYDKNYNWLNDYRRNYKYDKTGLCGPCCKWHWKSRKCDFRTSSDYDSSNDWWTDTRNCPNSTISFFTPKRGPWEGGTMIEIHGKNLNNELEKLPMGIKVGQVPCHIEKYLDDGLICKVSNLNATTFNTSRRILLENLSYTSRDEFTFVNPRIDQVTPQQGSISGGTVLTITGVHMDAGTLIEVFIGKLECAVVTRSNNSLKCVTGPSRRSNTNGVVVKFDGHQRTSENVTYMYDESLQADTNLLNVPRGTPSGGIKFPFVLDKNPSLSANQSILFYVQDKQLVMTYYSQCSLTNSFRIECLTPSICYNDYTMNENRPIQFDYGFKINTANEMKDILIDKVYPKFLLYPESMRDILLGNLPTSPTNTNWLMQNTYIVLAVIATLTLLIIVISVICYQKSAKRARKLQLQINKMGKDMIAMTQWVKKVVIENEIELDETTSNILKLPNVVIEYTSIPRLTEGKEILDEFELPVDEIWEFPRSSITLGKCLGEGEFGIVLKADADGIVQRNITTNVAIKMLKNIHTDADMVNLVSEMEMMKLIGQHDNVLQMLGCCTQNGPLLVITEYAARGNLLDLLRKSQNDLTDDEIIIDEVIKLCEKDLIGFALQIAKGMQYLASIKCIHRDLAARNILVSDNYTMKVADFGLARDVGSVYYYRQTSAGKVPIRWMAPETITHRRYTTQSDVWSYGVLLWEIITFGRIPYSSYIDLDKLAQAIQLGYRMEKPPNCSTRMYDIMSKCWSTRPDDRPTFTAVIAELEKILATLETIEEFSSSGSEISDSTDDEDSE